MKCKDIKCPVCGTVNYGVDVEETNGCMECIECGAIAVEDKKVVTFSVIEMDDTTLFG